MNQSTAETLPASVGLVAASRPGDEALQAPMLAHNHARVAELFRALSEPNRLSIIHCLSAGPHRVGEIAGHVGLAQSTVSAHLQVLRDAGIVTARAQGRATWYQLDNAGLGTVLDAAERLVAAVAAGPGGEE